MDECAFARILNRLITEWYSILIPAQLDSLLCLRAAASGWRNDFLFTYCRTRQGTAFTLDRMQETFDSNERFFDLLDRCRIRASDIAFADKSEHVARNRYYFPFLKQPFCELLGC
ncbi:hypothetical protein D3C84_1028350 [compost metagenome]